MKVEVTKQAVTITEQSVICEGDYCVNECIFDLPECFNGLSVTAVFNNIPVPVTDGKCIIPSLKKGNGVLGVYAYKKDSETDELELMYSPGSCGFWVDEGSYTQEVAAEEIPGISRYEEYCNMLSAYCSEYLDKVSCENAEELEKCEKLIRKVTSLGENSTDDEYPTAKVVYDAISAFQKVVAEEFLKCEKTGNKTEALSKESTNEQYPTAKAVYDYIGNNTSQEFEPESEKPQSGKAVAEAITGVVAGNVDLTPYAKLADIAESGRKIKIVAGVIRNTGNGWEFIENSTHEKLGFSAISEDAASITLTHNFTAKKILGFSVTPDETFAEQGYIAGASVGASSTVIRIATISKDIGGYVAYDETTSSWNTTNLRGINDATFSGGTLNLTHDSLGNAPQYLGSVAGRDGINASFGSLGTTNTQVKFYDNTGRLITTPTNACKAYVTRSRRTAYVTPASLVSESGNFWIVGVFEVE